MKTDLIEVETSTFSYDFKGADFSAGENCKMSFEGKRYGNGQKDRILIILEEMTPGVRLPPRWRCMHEYDHTIHTCILINMPDLR